MSYIEETTPSPSVEDLVNGYTCETTVQIPGKNIVHDVVLGTLWDNELRDIYIKTGKKVNAQDFISRETEVRFEILVKAITRIDDWICYDKDPEKDNALKFHLRKLLNKNPKMVTYLHECYQELVKKRDESFNLALIDLKKSSGMPNEQDLKMLNIVEDFQSGEDGGV